MAFNYTNLIGTGTDTELLEFARAAIAQILVTGQSYSMDGGRSLTRADLPELRQCVEWLEGRINTEAGDSNTNYCRFKRAQA